MHIKFGIIKIFFNYKKLKSGLIFDISSFPDSLGEVFISIFNPKMSLSLNNYYTLGSLSQLIMRYDRAAFFYNKAYIEIKNIYNRKINKLMVKQELYTKAKNKMMAGDIGLQISSLMEKKKNDVAAVMDLSLSSMYLSGKVKEVKNIIKMSGKKADFMYKNTVKLIKQSK
jgi:ABC-type siderophore export system fused ATPase/permease subunit